MTVSLQEEYFARHDLKVPYIKYAGNLNLLFKGRLKEVCPKWYGMCIQIKPNQNHPSNYTFVTFYPAPNSYGGNYFCNEVVTEIVLEEYENYIKEHVKALMSRGYFPVMDLQEANFIAMEMFVFQCERQIMHNSSVHKLIYDMIANKSMDVRQEAYNGLLKIIENSPSQIKNVWGHVQQKIQPSHYGTWLENFIEIACR